MPIDLQIMRHFGRSPPKSEPFDKIGNNHLFGEKATLQANIFKPDSIDTGYRDNGRCRLSPA
jgi:hypothetical protein